MNGEQVFGGPPKREPLRGDIIGNCGHSISDIWSDRKYLIITASRAKDGSRAVAYCAYCLPCQAIIRAKGCEVPESEVDAYLRGDIPERSAW